MNIHFYTLGCKVNQYETEAIRELFLKNGHLSVQGETADAVIINSCTVTAESDRKTRQLIRKCRRENPDAVIVLTGCMVQAFPEKAKKLSQADIIIGNKNPEKIISLTESYEGKKLFLYKPHKDKEKYNPLFVSDFCEHTRAFMKIEDGCDRFCSYCIIPYAKGRVRSRELEDIRTEAKALAKNGYKEIVLVGINLSAYGKGTDYNICDAVDAVAGIKDIKRVRLGSLEPDHITDDMLSRLKAEPKFCPQFHLSLQSGCDATLKRMNRHYNSKFYKDLTDRIREIFSDAAITTDVMVGFAGETEEEFRESLEFLKATGFARCHIFAYSVREGTNAAGFKNQVKKSEKEQRSYLMREAAAISENNFLKSQVGKVFPVLFEIGQKGYAVGYTPNYTKVLVKSVTPYTGEILNVKITSAEGELCYGELV